MWVQARARRARDVEEAWNRDIHRLVAGHPEAAPAACCDVFVLENTCASASMPWVPNGTVGSGVSRGATRVRSRLKRESAKWREELRANPPREYGTLL